MNPEPTRGKGPGALQWVFSLACSGLLATDVFVGRTSVLPRSAEGYYMALDWAPRFQTLGVTIDAVVLLATLAWIIYPGLAKRVKTTLVAISLLGVVLFWCESFYAVKHGSGPVFVLRELPFRPLANFGLLGAQVYASYLMFSLPSGKLPVVHAVLIKSALAACLFAYQALVWDGIAQAMGWAP